MLATYRIKYGRYDGVKYIAHLDMLRLFARAARRCSLPMAYSQGFNPHPKMSYGHALALGTESQGEYLDVEIESDEISIDEFLSRLNAAMPVGISFIKAMEITKQTPSLTSTIEYGEYLFNIDLEKPLSKEFVKGKVVDFMSKNEILISKKNKKGKTVEVDIRPMIKHFDVIDVEDSFVTFGATIATGSKANLNTNILVPMIVEMLGLDMDPLDVDILRRDLYVVENGELVTPM